MKVAICDDEKFYVEKVYEIANNFFTTQDIDADIYTFSCGEDLAECDEIFDGIVGSREFVFNDNFFRVFNIENRVVFEN